MHLAVSNDTPIIPVGIVGCEESIISLGSNKSLAKTFGLPAAPFLIPMVWPTKVIIHVGEPMYFDGDITREDVIVNYVEEVRREIDGLIQKGLEKRKGIFDF